MKLLNMRFVTLSLLLSAFASTRSLYAQNIAADNTEDEDNVQWSIKNNLLYDATLTPNLGIEARTGVRSTVQLFYGLHPWVFSGNKKLRHWSLMPEYRVYRKLQTSNLEAWFWGIHLVGGEYNVGGKKLPFGLFKPLRSSRYEGWYAGGGLTVGHAWRLSYHWRLEASVGVGYLHTRYHRYEVPVCGADLGIGHYNYVGPTKLALNLAYDLRRKRAVPAVVDTVVVVPPPPHVPQYRLPFVTPQTEAEKTRHLSGSAILDFEVNKTDIRPAYRRNADELAKVQQTIDVVRQDPNTTITHVSVHGFASPEGSYQNNARLAEGRARAFKDYVQMLISLSGAVFSVEATPEDWEGFLRLLRQPETDLGDKRNDIIAIAADPTLSPDEKEQRLRRLYPSAWKQLLSDVFPALRHSDYVVSYTVRPFTVDEARELIRHKPQQLSLNEMFLVAQTYEPGSPDYNDVFLTAVRLFPDDETANLNAAIIALRSSDIAEAARRLEKAGNSAEAWNARGVMYALQGDKARAAEAFSRSTLPEARHNEKESEQ